MNIVITGATGAIGRRLVTQLQGSHRITGIVRSTSTAPSSESHVTYVAFSDEAGLRASLLDADCVVHCALDTKTAKGQLVSANMAMMKRVLDLSLEGKCGLFVFFSSQVVYSSLQPAGPAGYREDQVTLLNGKEDAYTRLKNLGEKLVISKCTAAGKSYLILRPTIVMGEGTVWSEGIASLLKLLPIGLQDRTMNVIHVDDLARYVEKLIVADTRNEIVNLGGQNTPSRRYFERLGELTGKRIRFPPRWVQAGIERVVPSSVWFFRQDVAIDSSKVERLTGLTADDALRAGRLTVHPIIPSPKPLTPSDLLDAQQVRARFKTYGAGFSRLIDPQRTKVPMLLMESYRGVVSFDGDVITVKAGTTLAEVSAFLAEHNLTLATLPEFTGITAGACFFVDVHGSSCEYFSLLDLITEVKFLDAQGQTRISRPGDPMWSELRTREERFVLTEVTFKVQKSYYLTNRLTWQSDECIPEYLATTHKQSLSTTLEWYPAYRKCLIYTINRAQQPPRHSTKARAFYRGVPYRMQRLIVFLKMQGRHIQYDRYDRILGPWRNLVLKSTLLDLSLAPNAKILPDVEICVSIEDAVCLMKALQDGAQNGSIGFTAKSSVGLRFSYRHDADGPRGFVWVDFVFNDPNLLKRFLAIADETCKDGYLFHQGKFVPRTGLSAAPAD